MIIKIIINNPLKIFSENNFAISLYPPPYHILL